MTLRLQGLGARRIARQMDLPVATVRDWLAGRVPKHSVDLEPGVPVAPACAQCGSEAHRFDQLPFSYVYLLGLYLGDGYICLVHRGVYRLRVALDLRYPGIIRSAVEAVTEVRAGTAHVQRREGNWVEVSSYWKGWPCLFPQHGEGPKHARSIVLTAWQLALVNKWPDQLLRGLINSDGCRFRNTGRGNWVWPRYGFSQASDDIRNIFCYACDQLGVHWTASGDRTIYVSRKADVAKLDEFIGPKC